MAFVLKGEAEDLYFAEKAASALTHALNTKPLLQNHKFDVINVICEGCTAGLEVLRHKKRIMMACKLLDYWVRQDREKGVFKLLGLGTGLVIMEHLHISAVQHFIFYHFLFNDCLPLHLKQQIRTVFLPEFLRKLFIMMEPDPELLPEFYMKRLDGISAVFQHLLNSILNDHDYQGSDEVQEVSNKTLFSHCEYMRQVVFVENSGTLVRSITNIALGEHDSALKYEFIELLNVLLRSFKEGNLSVRREIMVPMATELVQRISAGITGAAVPNKTKRIKLPSFTVERPVNLFSLSLVRAVYYLVSLHPPASACIPADCWNSLFLSFFMCKSNGILCGLMSSISCFFVSNAAEKVLREVLVSRGVLHRLIYSAMETTNAPGEKDFICAVKNILERVKNYTSRCKTRLAEEILLNENWKDLVRSSNKTK